METIIGIAAALWALLLCGLSGAAAVQRRRMITALTRSPSALTRSPRTTPARWAGRAPVHRYALTADLEPAGDVSLEPRRSPAPEAGGYSLVTERPAIVPTVQSMFAVPMLTAIGTAAVVAILALALAWAVGLPVRAVAIITAAALAGGWFWRLGLADKVLWRVEEWSGRDLTGDGIPGRPPDFTLVNATRARGAVARQAAQDDLATRRAALLAFVDRCFVAGTSEGAHGIDASGPERDNYVRCRDALMAVGLAQWKNPERPRAGWVMTADPATTKGIVQNHVM
jgi:hypothetical protein